MKRKQIYALMGCIVFSFLLIFGFYTVSPLNREIKRSNFNRDFITRLSTPKQVIDLKVNSFYIAGASPDKFYLGNFTAPFHMFSSDFNGADTSSINITLGIDSIVEPLKFRMAVDPPYYYLNNGIMPEILRGKLGEDRATPYMDTIDFFVDAIPTGPQSVVYKTYNSYTSSYELATKRNGRNFKFNNDLLNREIDGMFCVDGQMLVDASRNEMVYMSYYKNEFIVCDTNINLKYRGHTIDTFKHARVKVTQFKAENKSVLAEPPTRINRYGCLYQGYLFVESALPSANENLESFINSSVVDVYNVDNGEYTGSFYIPKYEQNHVREFKIVGDHMIALYDRYAVIYEIPKANTNTLF